MKNNPNPFLFAAIMLNVAGLIITIYVLMQLRKEVSATTKPISDTMDKITKFLHL